MLQRLRIVSFIVLAAATGGCSPFRKVPPAPIPQYSYAEDALRRGDYQEAVVRFNAFLGQTEDPVYRLRALYQLAWAHYELHQYHQTMEMLDQLTIEYPKYSGPQVAALRGNAEYALGNQTNGFLSWEQAWQKGDDADREVLQGRMERALAAMDEPQLRQLAALTTDPDVTSMIQAYIDHPTHAGHAAPTPKPNVRHRTEPETLASGRLDDSPARVPPDDSQPEPSSEPGITTARAVATDSGAPTDSPQVARKPAAATLPPDVIEEDTPNLEDKPNLSESAPPAPPPVPPSENAPSAAPRVAALLPLTGADRQSGWDALNALRLAFLDSPNSLTVRDTAGQAALAKDLLAKLAADPSVVVVIGPLGSAEVDAVVMDADRLQIPVVPLADSSTDVHSRFIMHVGSQPPPDASETMALRFQQYTGRAPTKAESQAFITGFTLHDTVSKGVLTREAMVSLTAPEPVPGSLSAAQQ